jgi:GMP synthase (glutamine-hydrolysing)
LIAQTCFLSAAVDADWLERTLDSLRMLHDRRQRLFASCWGFQAMARALGGLVVKDPEHAELGTREVELTDAGIADPVFGPLGSPFYAQMGHEDVVAELPPGAIRLASTNRVKNQAYRLEGLPIYCTQFHPELNREALIERIITYPDYVKKIAGVSVDEFSPTVQDTPETEQLLTRFLEIACDS